MGFRSTNSLPRTDPNLPIPVNSPTDGDLSKATESTRTAGTDRAFGAKPPKKHRYHWLGPDDRREQVRLNVGRNRLSETRLINIRSVRIIA
jgi:hypothetical protein